MKVVCSGVDSRRADSGLNDELNDDALQVDEIEPVRFLLLDPYDI